MITFRNITTGQEINVGNVKRVADGRIFFSVRNAGCGQAFCSQSRKQSCFCSVSVDAFRHSRFAFAYNGRNHAVINV